MKNNGKYIIGITGGVGTGKSFISGYISGRFNAELISADEIAKSSYEKDGVCYDRIVEAFGEDILDRNKEIDRSYLARLVFADPELLEKLNEIIHPYVVRFVETKIDATKGLIIYEAALPEQAKLKELCDEVWFISSLRGLRIKRLMENRGYTKDRCEKMLASQPSDAEYKALSNVEIENNEDIFSALNKVDKQMTRVIMENGGIIL